MGFDNGWPLRDWTVGFGRLSSRTVPQRASCVVRWEWEWEVGVGVDVDVDGGGRLGGQGGSFGPSGSEI